MTICNHDLRPNPLRRNEFNSVPMVEPGFSVNAPLLFAFEEEEKLYFHEEKSAWFGMTKKGRYALMIDVRDGALLNQQLNEAESELIPRESDDSDDPYYSSSESRRSERRRSVVRKLNGRKTLTPEEQAERIKQLKYDTKKLIVRDFLLNEDISPFQYLQKISTRSRKLDGFNLLLGDIEQGLFFFSNRDPDKVAYEVVSGEYTIDDTPGLDTARDTRIPKILKAKRVFIDFIAEIEASSKKSLQSEEVEVVVDENDISSPSAQSVNNSFRKVNFLDKFHDSQAIGTLFRLMEDEEKFASPENLKVPSFYNGLDQKWEELLSSLFISSNVYSTRSATMLVVQSMKRKLKPPEKPVADSVVLSPTTSSARSIRERTLSLRSRGSAILKSAAQTAMKTVTKNRRLQVTCVHRVYDHKAMELLKGAAQDQPTTLDLDSLIERGKRKKVYTSLHYYFQITRPVTKQVEDKGGDSSHDLSDSDSESDTEPYSFEANSSKLKRIEDFTPKNQAK